MLLLSLLHLFVGLLLAGIAYPMTRGWVAPNRWYGFRTPSTLRSPAVWYPANACAGRWLLASGLVIAAAAAVLPWLPGVSFESYAWTMLVVTLGAVLISVVRSFVFLRTLAEPVASER